MARSYLWLALEGLALFLALGSVIEGLRQLHAGNTTGCLGWFSVWAAGCAFHEWRKEQRRNALVETGELEE